MGTIENRRQNTPTTPYWWQWYPAEYLGIEGMNEHLSFGHLDDDYLEAWNNLDLAFAKAAIDKKGAQQHFDEATAEFELAAQKEMDLRQLNFSGFHALLGYAYIPIFNARLEDRPQSFEEVRQTHNSLLRLGNIVLKSIHEFPDQTTSHKYAALTRLVSLQLLTRCYTGEEDTYFLPQLASLREVTGGYHAYLRPWHNDNEPMRLTFSRPRPNRRHPAIFHVPVFRFLYSELDTHDAEAALTRTQAELYGEFERCQYSPALNNVSQLMLDSICKRFSNRTT